MLVGKRRLGKALLELQIVYDLARIAGRSGFIEYSADRDRIDIRAALFDRVGAQADDAAGTRDQAADLAMEERLCAQRRCRPPDRYGREERLEYICVPQGGAVFSIWPRSRGCLEVVGSLTAWRLAKWNTGERSSSELVSSLPLEWGLRLQAFVLWMLLFYVQHERRAENSTRAPRENWWAVAGCPFHVKRWLEIPTPFGDFERDGFSSKGHPTRSFVRALFPGQTASRWS